MNIFRWVDQIRMKEKDDMKAIMLNKIEEIK